MGYQWERLPDNHQQLQNLIEQAGDTYTPVVVIADLWSFHLPKYRAVVRVFDRGKLDNCHVIFPWNLKDADTNRNRAKLRRMLAEVFPIQFHKTEKSLVFEGISDVKTFKDELSRLLTQYVAEINRSMQAVRELPPQGSAPQVPPQLGSTSKLP